MQPHRLADPQGRPTNWVYVPATPLPEVRAWVAGGGDVTGDGLADVVIGEPGFEKGRGRLLVFSGSPSGLASIPAVVLHGTHPAAHLGDWIQMVGDINGDGVDDLMVSEFSEGSANENDDGDERLLLLFGGDLASPPELTALDHTCVGAGDVNGDGFDDVVTYGRNDTVRVFHGSRSGLSHQPDWTATAEQAGSSFGALVCGAGDVNGDGFGDILVSAPTFSGRLRSGGKVYLYLGSRPGVGARAAWSAEYDEPITPTVDDPHEQHFGFGLASAGDVNQDGYDDVLVGARFAERGDRNEGLAFLFQGSSSGPSARPDWSVESNHPHALLGSALSGVFDLDGDGFDDVLIAAPYLSNGQVEEGAVAAFAGSKSGLSRQPCWTMEGDRSRDHLGQTVLSAGDLNGDGYTDVLLVAPGHSQTLSDGIVRPFGRVVAIYGGPGGLPASHSTSFEKPLLTALQQWVELHRLRYGPIVYWGPPLLGATSVIAVLWLALQRTRRQVARLTEAGRGRIRNEERTQIMRDVHDALGADLSQILADVHTMQAGICYREKEAELLERLSRSTNDAVETLDELVWVLNPASDRLSSFVDAAGEYATRFLGAHGIACHLDFPDQDEERYLPAQVRHCLHFVLKESLHNVVKHARASKVKVTLTLNGESLLLSIQDNGCGFEANDVPEAPAAHRSGPRTAGVGIASLRSRVEVLGGALNVRSSAEEGTTILSKIPCTS